MAVNLTKPAREITPVHILDEIETMPKPAAVPVIAAVSDPKPVSDSDPKSGPENRDKPKMGILERQQTLENNRKTITSKIVQSTVFTAKKDLKLMYCTDILEAGHRVVFHAPDYPYYGLDNFNLSVVTVDIGLLMDKSTRTIKFDVACFDDCFEPDFELSKLYSRNIITRLFHHKQINAYLENAKTELLRNRAVKALEMRDDKKG